jgi:hypothetical protein
MTTYTKTTDFAAKDSLTTGNPSKRVYGSEIDAEFNNIAIADATNVKTGTALVGVSNSGTAVSGVSIDSFGVSGTSTNSYGVVAHSDTSSPARAALRIIPQDTQPTTGQIGDIYVTTAGVLRICTVTGTPGTWATVGTQT